MDQLLQPPELDWGDGYRPLAEHEHRFTSPYPAARLNPWPQARKSAAQLFEIAQQIEDAPMNAQASLVSFIDSSIDQIVEWASIAPENVIEEFRAAGYQRSGGGFFEIIDHLRDARLGDADIIARRFIKVYAKMAAGQGFVTGLGGLITLPASVPADAAAYVGWLARTSSAIQLCYGFEHRTETADAQLKLAMLAGAGVSSVTIQGTEVLVTQLARRVMTTPYARAPIQAAVKAFASKVGITLTHKSFAKAVPIVGGAVNGSVQGGLVYFGAGRIREFYRELAGMSPD